VSRFRSGELNLLVATNIGSEGMDFKQCAAVVAFEPPPDVTSYIQVKARYSFAGSGCLCHNLASGHRVVTDNSLLCVSAVTSAAWRHAMMPACAVVLCLH
jgi:ERCC4-related helicase